METRQKVRRLLIAFGAIFASIILLLALFGHGDPQRIATGRWALWIPIVLFVAARNLFSEKGTLEHRVARTSYALPGGIGYLISILFLVIALVSIIALDHWLLRATKAGVLSREIGMDIFVAGSLVIVAVAFLTGRWMWRRFSPKPISASVPVSIIKES